MKKQPQFPRSQAEKLIREASGLSGELQWQPLYGDGSERSFQRVVSEQESLILIWSPPKDMDFPNENDSYVYMAEHLRRKSIPVPKILGYYRSEGLTLIEDLGSVHLQDVVSSTTDRVVDVYHQAIELLLRMQVRGAEDLDTSQCFDTPLYDQHFIIERELEYFRVNFLVGALGLEVDWDRVEPDFSLLASRASGGDDQLFFLHRDFQSRNLMLKDDLLYLIDFQGARLGPPQYDLAALLLDPYVQLEESFQRELLTSHSKGLSELSGTSVDELQVRYPHVALCRNLQVLAAFSFLTRVKGRVHFARYIMPAWKRLRKLLAQPECSDYQVLADLVRSKSDENVAEVAARLESEARGTAGNN